jgi:Na+/H+ antiporter NhaD/arsenite permease-like protein
MANSISEAILNLNLTDSYLGYAAVFIFIVSYILVISEEITGLRKSKPVLLASGFIWIIVAILAKQQQLMHFTAAAVKNTILDYSELLLFLIVAMTYINVLQERNVFDVLRAWLINKKFSLRQVFWITGILSFCISPIADNLTTALLMCSIVQAVAPNNNKFICAAAINIVVAANAGGAFSPFGDITTLMVWQANKLSFIDFFKLFIPSIINFIIPAGCISYFIENQLPHPVKETIQLKFGAKRVILLFLITIILSASINVLINLPAVIGMMTGLGLLKLFGFYIKKHEQKNNCTPFDIFTQLKQIEWDTLLFFYGVMLSIGGLATIGYLEKISIFLYNNLGANLSAMHQASPANIIIGMLSSIIDNIPIMFSIITMNPDMAKEQWMLVTLTAGIGGSLLSIGSAAGVALMGKTNGIYSFFSHLKWSWAILLGYFAAIYTHFLINF